MTKQKKQTSAKIQYSIVTRSKDNSLQRKRRTFQRLFSTKKSKSIKRKPKSKKNNKKALFKKLVNKNKIEAMFDYKILPCSNEKINFECKIKIWDSSIQKINLNKQSQQIHQNVNLVSSIQAQNSNILNNIASTEYMNQQIYQDKSIKNQQQNQEYKLEQQQQMKSLRIPQIQGEIQIKKIENIDMNIQTNSQKFVQRCELKIKQQPFQQYKESIKNTEQRKLQVKDHVQDLEVFEIQLEELVEEILNDREKNIEIQKKTENAIALNTQFDHSSVFLEQKPIKQSHIQPDQNIQNEYQTKQSGQIAEIHTQNLAGNQNIAKKNQLAKQQFELKQDKNELEMPFQANFLTKIDQMQDYINKINEEISEQQQYLQKQISQNNHLQNNQINKKIQKQQNIDREQVLPLEDTAYKQQNQQDEQIVKSNIAQIHSSLADSSICLYQLEAQHSPNDIENEDKYQNHKSNDVILQQQHIKKSTSSISNNQELSRQQNQEEEEISIICSQESQKLSERIGRTPALKYIPSQQQNAQSNSQENNQSNIQKRTQEILQLRQFYGRCLNKTQNQIELFLFDQSDFFLGATNSKGDLTFLFRENDINQLYQIVKLTQCLKNNSDFIDLLRKYINCLKNQTISVKSQCQITIGLQITEKKSNNYFTSRNIGNQIFVLRNSWKDEQNQAQSVNEKDSTFKKINTQKLKEANISQIKIKSLGQKLLNILPFIKTMLPAYQKDLFQIFVIMVTILEQNVLNSNQSNSVKKSNQKQSSFNEETPVPEEEVNYKINNFEIVESNISEPQKNVNEQIDTNKNQNSFLKKCNLYIQQIKSLIGLLGKAIVHRQQEKLEIKKDQFKNKNIKQQKKKNRKIITAKQKQKSPKNLYLKQVFDTLKDIQQEATTTNNHLNIERKNMRKWITEGPLCRKKQNSQFFKNKSTFQNVESQSKINLDLNLWFNQKTDHQKQPLNQSQENKKLQPQILQQQAKSHKV